MWKELKGVVKGKTAVGSVLLGLAFAFSQAYELNLIPFQLPETVLTFIMGIAGFLTFFGMYDAAEQQFVEFGEKLRAFIVTSPFAGLFVVVVTFLNENLEMITLPGVLEPLLLLLGSFLMLFGVKGSMVKARFNLSRPDPSFHKKYGREV